jgi:hypothetical protein
VRRHLGGDAQLFVHYNPAFMKAQTPYEFFGTARPEVMRTKLATLRAELVDEDVQIVTVIDDAMAYYQPVLALGDTQSAQILLDLYRKPTVTEPDWRTAFTRRGFDDTRYFEARGLEDRLPWEHIGYQDHAKLRRRATLIADVANRDHSRLRDASGVH